MINFRFLVIPFLVFTIAGCAAHGMALSKGQTDIALKKSIALVSIKTVNDYEPAFQFDLVGLIVCPQSEPCTNPRPYLYKAAGAYRSEKNRFNEYLVSLELAPGKYTIKSAAVVYTSLFANAGGYAPFDAKIEISPNTISYLGHVDIVLRKKKTAEEKTAGREQIDAGVLRVELSDKSIVGFSTGTIDIFIEDKFDEEMKVFASEYPALKKVRIEKAILPQWKRSEQQGAK